MDKIKMFLASPEGAAAITGFLRALFTILIGVGVAVTAEQAEQAVTTATSLIAITNILFTLVTVKVVTKRADQEEIDAAVSEKVLITNNAEPSPDA